MKLSLRRKQRCASIRAQVLAIALIPALVITLFLVFVVYRGSVLRGNEALTRQGQLLAAQLASTLEYALSTGAVDQIPVAIETTVKPAAEVLRTEVKGVTVFDKHDRVVYSAPSIRGSPRTGIDSSLGQTAAVEEIQTFMTSIYLDPLALAAEPAPARRYLGKVKIDISTAAIKAEYFDYFLVDMGLVLLTFSGVVLLAHLTGRRLSSAIQEAAQAIQRIKGGDLSVRLQKTESSEIGTLQEGVNLAAEAIVRGRQALERTLAEVRAEHAIALSQLQLQTQEAKRANQAKSMFLAKISHEMRTPLYSIQGLAEHLLKTARNEEEIRSLRNILRASQTLYHTISDILDFTQLEGGKYQPVLKAFELWDELETNTETIGLLAHEQGLYLDVIVGHDVPPAVIGDQKGFRTIVANLLSNAIKFTPQGGLCIHLEVESRCPDRQAIISLQVQDTGGGIPPDRLATIFKPFEQLEDGLNRRYAGSGLGLSIVKNYCDAMAGRISVESELGKGSIFRVRLPFEIGNSSFSPPRDADFSQLSALVIDERASFCKSVESRLSSLGIAVVQHPVALQACLALAPPPQRFPLVVVRDLSLAKSGGAIIRQLGAWGQHVVSFETGHDSERFQMLGEHGVAAVLWSGATRSSIVAALRMIPVEHPGKVIDSNVLESGERLGNPGTLGGRQVLVVEDFEINREIMSRQLSNHGLCVIEASDGDEAVARALQADIDLILMDIQMPGKDGITAIKEIRAIPACVRVPILGFTASADKPTNRQVIEAGADGVLTKPISEEELINAIQQVLLSKPISGHRPASVSSVKNEG